MTAGRDDDGAGRGGVSGALALAVASRLADRELDGGLCRETDAVLVDRDDGAVVAGLVGSCEAGASVEEVLRSLSRRRSLLALWVLVGLMVGVGAAWGGASFGGGAGVRSGADLNALFFLAATLGVHSVMLAGSVAIGVLGMVRCGGVMEGAAPRLISRLSGVAGGVSVLLHGGRRGVLRGQVISHAGGLGFTAGAFGAFFVSSALRERYEFFWKSTLLTDAQVESLFSALFWPVSRLGIAVPGGEAIAAASVDAGSGVGPGEARVWAGALLGAVVVFGVLPRGLLLVVSVVGVVWFDRRWSRGVIGRFAGAARLASARRARRLADAGVGASPLDDGTGDGGELEGGAADRPGGGGELYVAFDLDEERASGMASLEAEGRRVERAGQHAEREDLIRSLAGAPVRCDRVVVVSSLGETPTRGTVRFLGRLSRAAGCGVRLALVPGLGHRVGEEGSASRLRDRLARWREAAAESGLDGAGVIEFDPAQGGWGSLPGALAGERGVVDEAALRGGLELVGSAFERGVPDDERMVRVFAEIDLLFGVGGGSDRVGGGGMDVAALVKTARGRASELGRVLPSWAPRRPGWMAAGALGATFASLGGLAAVAGPGAIVAAVPLWPLYSAAGAALGEACGRGVGGFGAGAGESGVDRALAADGAVRLRAAGLHAAARFAAPLGPAVSAGLIEASFGRAGEPLVEEAAAWCGRLASALVAEAGVSATEGA